MKYLITIIFGLLLATATSAALFDWSVGHPAILGDNTSTTYYGWSNGQPAILYQYVSTGSSTPVVEIRKESVWWE